MKNDYNWIKDCAEDMSDYVQYHSDIYDKFYPEDFESIILRHLKRKTQIEVKFYYMYDNHTFEQLKGSTIDEIINHAREIESTYPYGMLREATIIYSDGSEKRVGESIHSSSKGFNPEDLKMWKEFVEADEEIMGFFKK